MELHTTPKIIIGIQARMGSSRLPGKVAKLICDRPLIEHLFHRAKKVKYVGDVFLLTSTNIENDLITKIADQCGIKTLRGSEQDVLSRFLDLASKESADHIIRICADSPILDVTEVQTLIAQHLNSRSEYTFNHIPTEDNGHANGIGAEIYDTNRFAEVVQITKNKNQLTDIHREHITKVFTDFSFLFKKHSIKAGDDIFGHQFDLDIDTQEDFDRISSIFNQLYYLSPQFGIRDIIASYKEGHLREELLYRKADG